nr:MAG TPA: hypothetical protein [Caudoviricetes sp.]
MLPLLPQNRKLATTGQQKGNINFSGLLPRKIA